MVVVLMMVDADDSSEDALICMHVLEREGEKERPRSQGHTQEDGTVRSTVADLRFGQSDLLDPPSMRFLMFFSFFLFSFFGGLMVLKEALVQLQVITHTEST